MKGRPTAERNTARTRRRAAAAEWVPLGRGAVDRVRVVTAAPIPAAATTIIVIDSLTGAGELLRRAQANGRTGRR